MSTTKLGDPEDGSRDSHPPDQTKANLGGNAAKYGPPPEPGSLGNIIDEFAGDTTAHGIPRIITRPRYIAKVFWLFLVCGAFYLFGSQSYQIISSFYSYNTKIDLVTRRELNFPAVTICNLNRMARSRLRGTRFEGLIDVDGGWSFDEGEADYDWFFDFSSEFWENNSSESSSSDSGSLSVPSTDSPSTESLSDSESLDLGEWGYSGVSWSFQYDDYYDWGGITDENDWKGFFDASMSADFSDLISALNPTSEELRDYGHKAEDFILQCTFDKRRCSYTDFKVFQNKEYGNCFTFNGDVKSNDSDTARNTTNSGSQYGLSLTLFIEDPEYVGLLSHDSGVRVTVHSADVFPYPEDSGMSAGTGQATSIGIRQTEIIRLESPWGSCTKGSNNGHSYLFKNDYEYTQRSCEKKCLYDKMAANCGCVTGIYPEYTQPKCSVLNSSEQKCKQFTEELFNNDALECDCPTPCHEIAYDVRATTTVWPSERYEEHLANKLGNQSERLSRVLQNITTTRNNIARLNIYFEDLNYESIEQVKAYTVYDILGAVGGLMGLYVGISLITLVEFMVFAFDVIVYGVRNTLLRNKVKPTNQ